MATKNETRKAKWDRQRADLESGLKDQSQVFEASFVAELHADIQSGRANILRFALGEFLVRLSGAIVTALRLFELALQLLRGGELAHGAFARGGLLR